MIFPYIKHGIAFRMLKAQISMIPKTCMRTQFFPQIRVYDFRTCKEKMSHGDIVITHQGLTINEISSNLFLCSRRKIESFFFSFFVTAGKHLNNANVLLDFAALSTVCKAWISQIVIAQACFISRAAPLNVLN